MVLSLLLSTFLTVFIAELGDKTQLATLTISGTSNKPLAVFLGSSSALVFASLLGDTFFYNHLPIRTPTILELIKARELPRKTIIGLPDSAESINVAI